MATAVKMPLSPACNAAFPMRPTSGFSGKNWVFSFTRNLLPAMTQLLPSIASILPARVVSTAVSFGVAVPG